MTQTANEFMRKYESASDTHDLNTVLSMIDDDAVYFFSNESVHIGKAHIETVLAHNFELIQDEAYSIENLTWLAESEEVAACVYDYVWSGTINGESVSGSGRGTTVLKRFDGDWKVIHEHLSRGKLSLEV
jgi:ketosteroid isomerase-like protein